MTNPWYLLKADSEPNSLFPTNLSVSVSNQESATGCCCKFDIYVGKSKEADDPLALGKSAAIVMNLVKGLEHKNYDVYMDNYYISVPLFLALADKGNWCMWHDTSKAALVDEVKRQPRGTSAWRANDYLLSMLWKDRKSILFLFSIH